MHQNKLQLNQPTHLNQSYKTSFLYPFYFTLLIYLCSGFLLLCKMEKLNATPYISHVSLYFIEHSSFWNAKPWCKEILDLLRTLFSWHQSSIYLYSFIVNHEPCCFLFLGLYVCRNAYCQMYLYLFLFLYTMSFILRNKNFLYKMSVNLI